jgi:hypothetical protein
MSFKPPEKKTSKAKAQAHDDLMPLLEAMADDFQEAAKKKPEAALNKRKVEIVNRLLTEVHKILDSESTHAYLDKLDEDDLPQNGDVALILGQTVAAMKSFAQKYYGYSSITHEHQWFTDD